MIDNFLNIEEENNLLVDEIEGFRYWLFIRDKVYSKLANLEPDIVPNKSNEFAKKIDNIFGSKVMKLTNKKVSFNDLVKIVKNLTISNPIHYKKEHLILIFPSPRRTLIDGKYYEYWTDPIADYYKEKCISAEFINIFNHLRPYWNDNVLEIDAVDIMPVLLYQIFRIPRKIQTQIDERVEFIVSCFKEKNGLVLDFNFIKNLIETRYIWYVYKKKYLKKFIKNINPKVIIEVCSYSTNNLIINEIAHELGIYTVELQHGVIGREHIGYNYLVNRRYELLPDKLLVFSKYWKDTCRFPIREENIIPVGYPFAEAQKRKYPCKEKKKNSINILIMSQPVFYSDLLKFTIEILKLLTRNGIEFNLVYKLHPTEYEQPLSNWNSILTYKEVRVINSSDVQLYELFAEADIQVGATSTSLYEGLLYNLDTYILDIGNAKERMQYLCKYGYARMVYSPLQFSNYMKTWNYDINKKRNIPEFFEKNSLLKTINVIENILSNK